MLNAIEKATRQKIEPLQLPSTETVNNKRIASFKQKISDILAAGELAFLKNLVDQYQQEHDVPAIEIAAALAAMSIGDQPLLMKPDRSSSARGSGNSTSRTDHREQQRSRHRGSTDESFETFRLEVGSLHGVKPGNIVGAIANEAGLDGQSIGHIDIKKQHSFVNLPTGMPQEVFKDLKQVQVCGQALDISRPDKPSVRTNSKPKSISKKKSRPKPKTSKGSKPKSRDKKKSAKAKEKKLKRKNRAV
jgi:ATP-dependent RNA helicase DeaD